MARVIIFADTHIGKRQFSASEHGRNTRECDIERAFFAAIDLIVQQQPDLVLCGGDVFEHPRVSAFAVKAWRDGVRRISTETEAHLVVVAGNHDVARSNEIMSPLTIPDDYDRVHIVLKPERINLTLASGEIASVSCFPFVVREEARTYKVEPDAKANVNCLLIHAAARTTAEGADGLPRFYAGPEALDVGREAERWDVIACGDYHTFTRLHPTALACYPGSTERTSSNIWAEPEPKGLVIADTVAKTLEFLHVPTRKMYDLPFAGDPSAEAVNATLANIAVCEDMEGAIVRLKIDGFPIAERDHIDWALVRRLQSLTTHFYLDIRYRQHEEQALGDRRERGLSLAQEAMRFFADDPAEVRAMALRYLDVEAAVEDETEDEL